MVTSLIPSVLALGLLAAVALALARGRVSPRHLDAQRREAARALLLALAAQSGHFVEELAGGFAIRFPALFGQPAMPLAAFVGINLACLALWAWSVPGLRAGRPAALFGAWFLAIAGVANLVAHPLMALAVGSYFPGLITAPVVGVAAIWLWRSLAAATERVP